MLLFLFFVLCFLFFFQSSNLLLSLILLELLSFFVLYIFSTTCYMGPTSDFIFLALFSIFVMEGVVALSGLITLVSFTGSDYVSSSSVLN